MTELRNFFVQLEAVIKSGIQIGQALHIISENLPPGNLRTKILQIGKIVDGGGKFSEAVSRVGLPFTKFHASFIKFGEESGNLDKICVSLASHAEKEVNLTRQLLGALIYPAFVLSVALLLGPIMTSVAGGQGAGGIVRGIFLNFLGLGLAIYGASFLWKRASGGSMDGFLNAVPYLGRLYKSVAWARFSRALAIGQNAGVPLSQALSTAVEVSGNTQLQAQLNHLPRHLDSGKSLSEGLAHVSDLPRTLYEMILIGEQSGTLPEMLDKSASYFEDEVGNSLSALMKVLPVILFLVVAAYAAFMIISMGIGVFNPRLPD